MRKKAFSVVSSGLELEFHPPLSGSYGGKKARDVGLTCRCHLSNIMPDSIFYDNMGLGMTQLLFLLLFFFLLLLLFFFLGVVIAVFLSIKEMDSVLSL